MEWLMHVTSLDYLNNLRAAELEAAIPLMRPGAELLEIGAGTGRQALELRKLGFKVQAIELGSSNYKESRLYPILDYDGRTFPFPDNSFDVVFSSNTLEHVPDLPAMHSEIKRVLRPSGQCIHILPTHGWRWWTSALAFPGAAAKLVRARSMDQVYRSVRKLGRAVLQNRHGERGNAWTELWYFHPQWWRQNFLSNGFEVCHDGPVHLFYSGESLLGSKLSIGDRRRASRWLGSACHIFQLRPKQL